MILTRFAPSPNGPLHLGHAFSAVTAHDLAEDRGGRFLLRVEDIDGVRSQPQLTAEFRADLAWLGLEWDDVAAQSTRLADYAAAAETLKSQGLLYPCSCTRTDIAEAAQGDAGGVQGPDGPLYPGSCRGKGMATDGAIAWRLDVAEALRLTGPLEWEDELAGVQQARPEIFGDVVLLRKEAPASYHLAATLDDAADGVTLVTRGMDLFAASHIHRLLQALLGLPVPIWHHHALLLGGDGKKLAKRRGSQSLADRRMAGEDGRALADALRRAELPAGISLSEGLNRPL